ncbi:hypothetical protein V492_03210 [Pseudogymnoascus sp. VKM F-4246]|nr:hypothetical protein V492_03210 [Pseudogymnoascus sp. VKM F-4246]
MDPVDAEPSSADGEDKEVQQLLLDYYRESAPRSTRRRRSPSPETYSPRRNLRPRRFRQRYFVTESESFDFDSPEDALPTAAQVDENTANQPTITSDTASLNTGPFPASQTDGNLTLTPSNAVPSSDAVPMAPQTKTETRRPDMTTNDAYQRRRLSVDARLRSAIAEDEYLKTHKRNQDARELTVMLAVNLSDTIERDDKLTAAVKAEDKVLDDQMAELLEILDRYDETIEAQMKMHELAEITERRKRLVELIEFLGKKVQRQKEVPDGYDETKLMGIQDEVKAESDRNPIVTDDRKHETVGRTSIGEDDKCDESVEGEREKTTRTKNYEHDGDDDEDYEMGEGSEDDEHDGDDDGDYEIDESSEDDLGDFTVPDDSDDYDYQDGDSDLEYREDDD